MKIKSFTSAAMFQRWLAKNHDQVTELWVGFHKKNSGKKSITYPEALDEALTFGWIDGIRKSVDETSYTIRFTPRKPKSVWSLVNTKRVEQLTKLGRMKPAGLRAFARRDPNKGGIYSFENIPREFSPTLKERFRANQAAWAFFHAQPPGYQRKATFWVMSAKQDETRLRRLDQLITDSAQRRRQGIVTGGKKT